MSNTEITSTNSLKENPIPTLFEMAGRRIISHCILIPSSPDPFQVWSAIPFFTTHRGLTRFRIFCFHHLLNLCSNLPNEISLSAFRSMLSFRPTTLRHLTLTLPNLSSSALLLLGKLPLDTLSLHDFRNFSWPHLSSLLSPANTIHKTLTKFSLMKSFFLVPNYLDPSSCFQYKLPRLSEIQISNTPSLTSSMIAPLLSACTALTRLDISYNSQLDSSCLTNVTFENLTHLNLSEDYLISSKSLAHIISRAVSLVELNLRGHISLQIHHIKLISNLRSLQFLSVPIPSNSAYPPLYPSFFFDKVSKKGIFGSSLRKLRLESVKITGEQGVQFAATLGFYSPRITCLVVQSVSKLALAILILSLSDLIQITCIDSESTTSSMTVPYRFASRIGLDLFSGDENFLCGTCTKPPLQTTDRPSDSNPKSSDVGPSKRYPSFIKKSSSGSFSTLRNNSPLSSGSSGTLFDSSIFFADILPIWDDEIINHPFVKKCCKFYSQLRNKRVSLT